MSEQTEEEQQVDPALQALLDEAIASENQQIDVAVRTHLQQRVVSTSIQLRQATAIIANHETTIAELKAELEETKKLVPKQPADRRPRKTAAKKSTVTPIKK